MKIKNTLSNISRIKEAADNFIMRELEKKGIKGIVTSHGGILHHLYLSQSPLTMTDLSGKINKTQPTITVLINKLVALGYVKKEKSQNDGRIFYISLTKKGESFRKIFYEISQELNKKIHSVLTETESDTIDELLGKIAKNF
ncbi:MAG: MarR family winged helix-turn-helix transcriptional regulator [Spirochaetota bacterium]